MRLVPVEPKERSGILFILSSPSGTGKSSIARLLLKRTPGLVFSVSHTTRAPRPGETNGREYHFVSGEEFRGMMSRGEFLEWAEVYGCLYGTASRPVREALASGQDVLLDIDVQGATQVRRAEPDCVGVFVLPPDFETLRRRLETRGADSPESMMARLAVARSEVEHHARYDYVVINSVLETSVAEVGAIVMAERRRAGRMAGPASKILASFPSPEKGR